MSHRRNTDQYDRRDRIESGLFDRLNGWQVMHGPKAGQYEQRGAWTGLGSDAEAEAAFQALRASVPVAVTGGTGAEDVQKIAEVLTAISARAEVPSILDLTTGEIREDRAGVKSAATLPGLASGLPTAESGRVAPGLHTAQFPSDPDSNTGSGNTSPASDQAIKENRALIDYLGCTFHGEKAMFLAESYFGPGMQWDENQKGGYFFKHAKKRGDVTIYYDHLDEKAAVTNPVFVLARGKGCRQLESERLVRGVSSFENDGVAPWQAFFADLLAAGAKFPRLDVALDCFDGSLNLDEVMAAVEALQCSTKFGIVEPRKPRDPHDGRIIGHSVNFGQRSSKTYLRMYHKGIEQVEKGEAEEVADWVRCELEAHDERAYKLASAIVQYGMKAVAEVIWSYVDFKTRESGGDSNKSRRPTCPWWSDFLAAVQKLTLGCDPRERDLNKIVRWIDKQVAPSLYVLREAVGGGRALLEALIDGAADRLSQQHLAILVKAALKGNINETHRFSNLGGSLQYS